MPFEEAAISLADNLDEIARLGEWVSAFCERLHLGSKAEFQLNLALEELITNAISHGRATRVDVKLRLAAPGVEAEIVDDGGPFDPTAAGEADLSGDIADRQVGGLGIHLVRRMVHDLAFARRGNQNRMTFRMKVE